MSEPDTSSVFPRIGQAGERLDQAGMTMRDYFAGQAIAGLCAINNRWGTWTMEPEEAVDTAFKIADLMMQRRSKP